MYGHAYDRTCIDRPERRLGLMERQGCSPGVCYSRYIEGGIATSYALLAPEDNPLSMMRSRPFLYRSIVALIILAVTMVVSVIWQRMVYTIPVLAVLLFLAAGLNGISGNSTVRNLDEDAPDIEADSD